MLGKTTQNENAAQWTSDPVISKCCFRCLFCASAYYCQFKILQESFSKGIGFVLSEWENLSAYLLKLVVIGPEGKRICYILEKKSHQANKI